MKYFLIGTDEKNRIPYNINKNRAVDVRTLTREGIGTLPMWNIIGMDLPDEIACVVKAHLSGGLLHRDALLGQKEPGLGEAVLAEV